MRKKLALLGFALTLMAASATPPASALTCKVGTHLIVCPTYSFCCPNGAFCICPQQP